MSESVAECFISDTDISPIERETNFSFNAKDHTMRIFASQRTVMKSLWSHTYVDVDRLSVLEDGLYTTITPEDHDGQKIVGLWADAPLGLLKVGKSPRSQNTPSSVVSDQEEVVGFNE